MENDIGLNRPEPITSEIEVILFSKRMVPQDASGLAIDDYSLADCHAIHTPNQVSGWCSGMDPET
jgi:hypothetical protein